MEYRQFGQTDLQASAIGFGCWEVGGTYGKIDEAQFHQAVQRAVDVGINCFDTAEAYGMGASEQALARALGARRKNIHIVTKFGVGYEEACGPQKLDLHAVKGFPRLRPHGFMAHTTHWTLALEVVTI
jgi:aryl-alcohol dehydrogenase-like predicted oxidoreductase